MKWKGNVYGCCWLSMWVKYADEVNELVSVGKVCECMWMK